MRDTKGRRREGRGQGGDTSGRGADNIMITTAMISIMLPTFTLAIPTPIATSPTAANAMLMAILTMKTSTTVAVASVASRSRLRNPPKPSFSFDDAGFGSLAPRITYVLLPPARTFLLLVSCVVLVEGKRRGPFDTMGGREGDGGDEGSPRSPVGVSSVLALCLQ